MATNFFTFKQFQTSKRAEFLAEYHDRDYLPDWMAMNARIEDYEHYCADLINSGIRPPLPVADTWTPETLYNLKKHYTERGSLDWYVPAEYRTNNEKFEK
jgi:hypothetical protein